jgi:putative Mg2+ transporter-C (MgtC) family protein
MLSDSEVVIRFIVAGLVGLMLGLARRKKPAGVRTLALICLGCTMFTIVSINTGFSNVDPTRVIAQIVTGIGFLGLGTIWRYGGRPTGLTTAATVWTTAAIGVLVGLGMWIEVIAGSILVLAILYSKEPLIEAHIEDRGI